VVRAKNSEGKKIYWIPGHCGVEVRGPPQRQSNQSRQKHSISYQWQTLKPIGKIKAKKSFTLSVKTQSGTEDKTTLKGTTGMVDLCGSAR
jgi:hypothetical protein